ncbi:MAG TPA: alpha/beta hydrolase [Flavisolibacter sp.]|nr:alpha/beta hydrolase [Flavisolibacter sp.]
MKMILTLLISMSLITSCQRNEHVFAKEDLSQPKTILDLSYGKDTAQRMDVYLPVNRSVDSTKSIILIHGGGWNSGGKNDFATYIDSFKKRMPDYAIFNLDYRLVNGGNLFPTQEQDVKTAIDFIVHNSGQYHINKNKLVLLGASAGAHLALLQGYKYNNPKIAAIIDFFGPTDLVTMFQKPWHPYVPFVLQMITGTTPKQNLSLYQQSSPINYVNTHSAPTLILHGGSDNIVNVSQSQSLKNMLDKAKVKNELIVYPGKSHGWHGPTLSNSFDRIEEFLQTNVR